MFRKDWWKSLLVGGLFSLIGGLLFGFGTVGWLITLIIGLLIYTIVIGGVGLILDEIEEDDKKQKKK